MFTIFRMPLELSDRLETARVAKKRYERALKTIGAQVEVTAEGCLKVHILSEAHRKAALAILDEAQGYTILLGTKELPMMR